MNVLVKGKPWSAELENQLRELLHAGKSVKVVAKVLCKTQNAIRQKMIKLELVEEKKTENSAVFSSTLVLPKDLPLSLIHI